MKLTFSLSLGQPLAVIAASLLLGACTDRVPVAPRAYAATPARLEMSMTADENDALATLRQATARYHRLDAALADGFVFLHGCEVRTESGPVGIVYINPRRVFDGAIDPALPDGLIYEARNNEEPRLVAVELAIPFTQSTAAQPPSFLGATFQREDEFGVFGLHVWLWRNNPNGLFEESNPDVSCTQ